MNDTQESEEQMITSYKIVLLGASSVGKTSLINQFIHHKFAQDYRGTIGANMYGKDIRRGEKLYKFIIWDIGGNERYDLIRNMYLNGTFGAIMVYDITRPNTLAKLQKQIYNDFKTFSLPNAKFVILGNKNDLTPYKKVKREQGERVAEQLNADGFYETSAKTGEHVQRAFKDLLDNIIQENFSQKSNSGQVNIHT